ncbi:MAG: matrixin family metalloprotease [Candidatus Stahlbacteria bacterium]|nr:matrixin family metalloprotease [Candidatus Stahlbacteria bacterium]
MKVKYYISTANIPNCLNRNETINAINGGHYVWNQVRDCDFEFRCRGTTSNSSWNNNDNCNTVYFNSIAGYDIGVAYVRPQGSYIVEIDIAFNPNKRWATDGSANAFDLQSNAAHEFGHALGLDHSDIWNSVMYPNDVVGTIRRTLDQDDIDGIKSLYPRGGGGGCKTSITSADIVLFTEFADMLITKVEVPMDCIYSSYTDFESRIIPLIRHDVLLQEITQNMYKLLKPEMEYFILTNGSGKNVISDEEIGLLTLWCERIAELDTSELGKEFARVKQSIYKGKGMYLKDFLSSDILAPFPPRILGNEESEYLMKLYWADIPEADQIKVGTDSYYVYQNGVKIASVSDTQYVDANPPYCDSYYKITAVDKNGNESNFSDSVLIRGKNETETSPVFEVTTICFNPFSKNITIKYFIPEEIRVLLKIYDLSGRVVQTLLNEVKKAGNYKVNCKLDNHSTGTYFVKLEAGKRKVTKKIILIR